VKLTVVILCGGMGLRLREETERRPKPLIDIGGKPLLWHLMNHYSSYGHQRFVLCLGYLGDMIKRYFLHYNIMNSDAEITLKPGSAPDVRILNSNLDPWTIVLSDTGLETQTGARVKRIQPYVNDDLFLLTYGDGLSNVNLDELLAFHQQHGKIATVTGVHPSSRFGELISDHGKVLQFSEKPQSHTGLINGGFFVFNRRVFDYLSPEPGCQLEAAPLEKLARDGELMVYTHKGFWQCMDTYRDFQLLNTLWNAGNAPWTKPHHS